MTANISFLSFRRDFIFSAFFFLYVFWLPVADAGIYKQGEVLVQLKPAAGKAVLDRHRVAMGLRIQRTLNSGRLIRFRLSDKVTVAEAMAELNRDPEVLFAEPNYFVSAQSAPNDPFFTLQWGLNNTGQTVNGDTGTPGIDIGVLQAWGLVQDSRQIIVAVIDTGCALDHPDLAERIWINAKEVPNNGIDDDNNGYVDDIHGWDMLDNDNLPWDVSGHGTHVAGIVAAQSNNGLGISGVTPSARILPLRFMNAFEIGTVADAVSAIEYAVSQGVRIINCSWGVPNFSRVLYRAMAAADALFVCSAGNFHSDNDAVDFYPASYDLDNVLSVAAVDQNGRLAEFSNYGHQQVDVAAPGVNIYSLAIEQRTIWETDFRSGSLTDWTTGGESDQWDVRHPPGASDPYALSTTSPGGHAAGADSWARTPGIELNHHNALMLKFSLMGDSQARQDILWVEVSSNGDQWRSLPVRIDDTVYYQGISDLNGDWHGAEVDLGSCDKMVRLYLRLHFKCAGGASGTGFFFQNLEITTSAADDTYTYMDGTSMAAAFVSGLGAMIQSLRPDLSGAALNHLIQSSIDQPQIFEVPFSSRGRVNAYNAVVMTPAYEFDPVDDSGRGKRGCFVGTMAGGMGLD